MITNRTPNSEPNYSFISKQSSLYSFDGCSGFKLANMSSNESTELPSIVTVLFDFSGENDGEHIEMKKGELLRIVRKVNDDWWQVKRLNGCPNGNSETNNALVIENRQQIDQDNTNGNSNMFYAPVSYLREINCNEQINLSNNKHKTTIKVGLCFTNPLSSGFSTDDTLSEDDQLNDERDSSKESLIDDMNGNEIIKSIHSCDKSMKSNLITKNKSPPSPPIYSNLRIMKSHRSPAVPSPGLSPIRILLNHWAEYQDSNGRKYYYNSLSRECSWKPPRRKTFYCRDDEATSHSEENLTDSSSCASLSIHNNNKLSSSSTSNSSFKSKLKFKKPIKFNKKESSNSNSTNTIHPPTNNQCSVPQLPKGWTRKYNAETRELYFVNENTKQKVISL